MNKDLELSDGQYNAALAIFFVSYSIFEPLTNILLKKHRPSIFIPVTMYVRDSHQYVISFLYILTRQDALGNLYDPHGICVQLEWADGGAVVLRTH